MHRVEPLGGKVRQRPSHRPPLAPHHECRHDSARSRRVGGETLLEWQVEDDGHGWPTVALGEAQECLSVPGHDVRCVDDGQQPIPKACVGHGVQSAEYLFLPPLIPRVTKDALPERV